MLHSNDEYNNYIIVHAIDDAIVADTNGILPLFLTFHCDCRTRTRIFRKGTDPFVNTTANGVRKRGNLFLVRWDDEDTEGHSSPSSFRTLS